MDRYRCEQTLRRMDSYLDRELSPQETRLVTEHLELCAGCAERIRLEGSFLADVRAKLQRVRVPAGLIGRVRACLQEDA